MRISVDRTDPGFREDANVLAIAVYLDGVRMEQCYTADSDKGEVWLGSRLPDREPIESRESIGYWSSYLYRGKVEIIEDDTGRKL